MELTLNDGTVLENSHCGKSGNLLMVYVVQQQATLADIFELLNDTEKTAVITANEFGTVTEYEGFTELISIAKDYGQISAALRKENT